MNRLVKLFLPSKVFFAHLSGKIESHCPQLGLSEFSIYCPQIPKLYNI